MNQNRLHLNFQLDTAEERTSFCEAYIPSVTDLTPKELETMATYILWGKNENGLNTQQEKLCALKQWSSTQIPQSYEELVENPMFSESQIHPLTDPPQKVPRVRLDRSRIRATAPPYYLQVFENLWREIDRTELLTTFYELQHKRRTKPVRPELLARFKPEDIESLEAQASTLSQLVYLRLRHQLVELRREQYTLKDEYAPLHQSRTTHSYSESSRLRLGQEVSILPLGLLCDTPPDLRPQVWMYPISPQPSVDQAALSKFLWSRPIPEPGLPTFDFRNPTHLWCAFRALHDLHEELPAFAETLEWYAAATKLNPTHRLIFNMKMEGKTNSEIQSKVNSAFGTSYNENYISTIWKKKILEEIAHTATLQAEELKEVFFEENWKRCRRCGRLLLRDPRYFMRKKTSSDGLGARCKQCEKEIRDSKAKEVIKK